MALALTVTASSAIAQNGERWYQIEVTVFAHENSNTLQEQWPVDDPALVYPANTRELDSLLKHLTLDDWSALQPPVAGVTPIAGDIDAESEETTLSPGPLALRSSDYRLPDEQRDAFVALPATEHDFTQTNRALNESSAYRILAHTAWRQPVMRANGATPIAIVGGRQFDDHHELEGTLTIRFNTSRDRVMLDTNLRLARFSTQPPAQELGSEQALRPDQALRPNQGPGTDQALPENNFYVSEVFPMRDTRAMRSNEFHYLDHPAMGVLVQVFPYEPPTEPVNSFPGTTPPL